MSDLEARLVREMSLVSALLYGAGATLAAVSLVVPHWAGLEIGPLTAVIAVAYLAVIVFAVLYARGIAAPIWLFVVSSMTGSVLVAVLVYFGGPSAAGTYGILYVFVAAFAAYYFPGRIAAITLVFAAIAYAGALLMLGHGSGPAEWVVVIGASYTAGGMIGGLGRRARELYRSEHRTVERLRELDAMKTTFLQAVSHELRTPLTAVSGYADLLERREGELSDDQRREMLGRLARNSKRLETLLTDLLDVDRLSRGILALRRVPTDMGAVVRDVCEQVRGDGGPLVVQTETVIVPADRPKVERIVENLVANARKHTPAGTEVRVRLEADGPGALLNVEDDGHGVPASARERIFDPFHQGDGPLDPQRPGTGIGLTLVQRFVHLHGGEVWVEDAPSGGARFCVRFPGAEEIDAPEHEVVVVPDSEHGEDREASVRAAE